MPWKLQNSQLSKRSDLCPTMKKSSRFSTLTGCKQRNPFSSCILICPSVPKSKAAEFLHELCCFPSYPIKRLETLVIQQCKQSLSLRYPFCYIMVKVLRKKATDKFSWKEWCADSISFFHDSYWNFNVIAANIIATESCYMLYFETIIKKGHLTKVPPKGLDMVCEMKTIEQWQMSFYEGLKKL